jgi:hypothetical protein
MTRTKDTGLAAIARSTRKMLGTKQPGRKPAMAEEKPPLELEGRHQNRGIRLDVGLWTCVLETAYLLTKRMRTMSRGRVTLVNVLKTAFIAFHELPLEQQIELIRKHD